MAKKTIIKDVELGNSGEVSKDKINSNFEQLDKAVDVLDGEAFKKENLTESLGFSRDKAPSEYAVSKEAQRLQKGIDSKPNAEDIAIGLINKGSVSTVANLPSNATRGDAYYVESEGFIYQFDGSKWNKTIFTAFPTDVATIVDVYNISTPPITQDGNGKRLIDAFWGNSAYKDSPWQIMELNKDTGVVEIRRTDNWAKMSGQGVLLNGFELMKVGSNQNCMFLIINWNAEDGNIKNENASGFARFGIGYPVSEIGKRIFSMFENKQYRLTDNAVFNTDGILQACNCVWVDGISGVMTLSNYDSATLEYRDCSVTYSGLTVKYGTRTLNELGETTKQGLLNIY